MSEAPHQAADRATGNALLQGKRILISGGARGLGRAFGAACRREGAQVVLADILHAEGRASADALAAQFVPLDLADPAAAHAALQQADMVVAFTSFKDAAVEGADVLLPIAPFSETSGTFVNAEGRVQGFHGVVKPLGDEAALAARLSNDVMVQAQAGAVPQGLQRLADVPIYATDALVRRAESLQLTTDAQAPQAGLAPGLWAALELKAGERVRVSQGAGSVVLPARMETTLAEGVVRVPAGHADVVGLGPMSGTLSVERVVTSAVGTPAQESGVAA